MPSIEPGEKFKVGYGKGHEIEVVALAGRKQRTLADKVRELVAAESEQRGLELFQLAEEALALCVGDERATELFDTVLDAELAIEIATATLGKQALSEDEEKKSE